VDGAFRDRRSDLEDATRGRRNIRESRANAERMLRDAEAANKMTLSMEATARQAVEDARQKAERC